MNGNNLTNNLKTQQFWLNVLTSVVAGVIVLAVAAIPFISIGKRIMIVITGTPSGPPVGTIVAWHRDLATPGIISLPSGWIECNGQQVSDPDSPFHGKSVPKLNAEKRFLRGGDTSGVLQDATRVAVVVETNENELFFNRSGRHDTEINGAFEDDPDRLGPHQRAAIMKTASDDLGEGQIYGGRVRPINMSVIWIIRIK